MFGMSFGLNLARFANPVISGFIISLISISERFNWIGVNWNIKYPNGVCVCVYTRVCARHTRHDPRDGEQLIGARSSVTCWPIGNGIFQ